MRVCAVSDCEKPHPLQHCGNLKDAFVNNNSNALIALLHDDARQRFMDHATVVELTAGSSLWEGNQSTPYAYWPGSGMVSLMATVQGAPGLEVRMVGSEGLAGLHTVMGFAASALTATVQVSGLAWRCERDALASQCETGIAQAGSFANVMTRYAGAVVAQMTSFAVCLRFHHIEQRLAKWLLMAQDRARSSHLHVTQEALSTLLGVRRVSVTNAATALQDLQLIYYRRGEISLLNRKGLEAQVCSCYRLDAQLFRSHLRSTLFTGLAN
jgi:CRP-like cAMP-binding protein